MRCTLAAAFVAGAPVGAAHAWVLLPSGPDEVASEGALPPVRASPAPGAAAAASGGTTAPAVARPGGAASAAEAAAAAAAAAKTPRDATPPPGAAPDGARKLLITLPLELEVHGRFFVGVAADERDAWGRTFGVSSARLGIEARLPGVETVVEADLASTPLIEDAYVRIDGPGVTRLTAGRFKAPFSERRLDSAWSLPLVDRGLVDRYLVKRNGLGGRRVGLAGTLRPWGGRLDATGGVFLGDSEALEARSDAGEDWAARVAARRQGVELGASGYRAGHATGAAPVPARWAAGPFVNLDLGPVRAALEAFAGSVAEGPFSAGTALLSWRLRAGEARRLRLTPVVGMEALRLRGATPGVGYGAIAGAVISWTEGLKVKLQGEWARRPGDGSPAVAVAAEVGSRF
ncbi:MAG TPA: hypothetical protein VFL83_15055 [Anaeromyxobacter sp.]|nr:hypothetical protein [Anaeromyxobacter sp.]